jgi:hypothetical protein
MIFELVCTVGRSDPVGEELQNARSRNIDKSKGDPAEAHRTRITRWQNVRTPEAQEVPRRASLSRDAQAPPKKRRKRAPQNN